MTGNEGLRVRIWLLMMEDDGKDPDNYLDLADFERKGETAPTLIAERVQVFNNGIDTGPAESDSGASNSGAIMQISDSSIWGNGWSGVWTAGWHGSGGQQHWYGQQISRQRQNRPRECHHL